jgi:hypothetical protein
MSTGDRKAYLATILAERRTLKNPRESFMRDGFDYASQRMGEFANPRKLEKGELLDIRKHTPAMEMPEEIVNPYQAEAVETMQGMGVRMKKHRAPKSMDTCMCEGSAKPKSKKAPMVHDFGMGAARPTTPSLSAFSYLRHVKNASMNGMGGARPASLLSHLRRAESVSMNGMGGAAPSRQVGAAKPRRAPPSGRAPSRWLLHVRDFAAKHGVSYKEAMSAARSSYQK